MLGELITNSLVLILGYAYPAFECFKTIEKHGAPNAELRFWCQYWVIIAMLTVFERIGDIFISWVPMYGEMKLALIIYLWYPKTKGTGYVYNAMLRPFVARHETDIETSLKEMRAKAWDVAVYYWHNSTELGQARIFEIFRYLASQPSRARSEVSANHQNPGAGRPPPPSPPPPPPSVAPSVAPPSVPRPDTAEDMWIPTAPPMPNNISHRQPVYPEEMHIPGSPSRPGSNPGQREPVWLRFKKSRGL
ncbi:TB2/DP1/HVA22-related protein [Artemisia annua]|uniref:HVA22-like protein n=1 Tax=Artemisia annua TaxID=35608 RepID=A0A2U1KXN8_ARTAN|nr:TB2/DP1/HVA22-related protein [Artemisia annua]